MSPIITISIMVFDVLHHFQISFTKSAVFTAGSNFRSISRVMGVIHEFGFRRFASFSDALTAR